ncbi:hypothetical protein BDN72DRAFT_880439 [Pluteus cervinus]|uniref:Uncharacterized protein n=1 Tax=Pluteus cervinus TaxID=181527 RepID=A0ACD3AL67_9AGAR|nr:hypothetical protein BDN72DRAFT_880439 [Pluteus cervinus]
MTTNRGSRAFSDAKADSKVLPKPLRLLPGMPQGALVYGQKIQPGTPPDRSGFCEEGLLDFDNGSSSYSTSTKVLRPRSKSTGSKQRVPYSKDARNVSRTERARARKFSEKKATRSRSVASSPLGGPTPGGSRHSLSSPLSSQVFTSPYTPTSTFSSPDYIPTRRASADLCNSSPSIAFTPTPTSSQACINSGNSLLLAQVYPNSGDCGPSAYATHGNADVDCINIPLSSITDLPFHTSVPVEFYDPSTSSTQTNFQPNQYQDAYDSSPFHYISAQGHPHNIAFGSTPVFQQQAIVFESNQVLSTIPAHNTGYPYTIGYHPSEHSQNVYSRDYPF